MDRVLSRCGLSGRPYDQASVLWLCRYVQQVSKGAEAAAKAQNLASTAAERKKKKEQEEAAAREMASLFAPAIKQPKPPPGSDRYPCCSLNFALPPLRIN